MVIKVEIKRISHSSERYRLHLGSYNLLKGYAGVVSFFALPTTLIKFLLKSYEI